MKNTTALLLLFLSVALFYTFTSPYYEKVKVLRVSAGDYQKVLDNITRIAETKDRLLVNYEDVPKAEIERLGKVLPDHVDTVRFAQELDTISSRYGIALKNVRINTASAQNASLPVLPEYEKPYEKTTLSFAFISDYANFRRFLEDLEKSLRIIDVKSLAFTNSESGLTEYQASIDTYWLKALVSDDDATLVKTAAELSSIDFNNDLFAAPAYRFLTDFSIIIPQEPVGRPNPFDAIGRD